MKVEKGGGRRVDGGLKKGLLLIPRTTNGFGDRAARAARIGSPGTTPCPTPRSGAQTMAVQEAVTSHLKHGSGASADRSGRWTSPPLSSKQPIKGLAFVVFRMLTGRFAFEKGSAVAK